VSEPTRSRADQRRERRRAQVRRTAVLLGVLFAVALAFAVWLAFDAPAPPGRDAGLAPDVGPASAVLAPTGRGPGRD